MKNSGFRGASLSKKIAGVVLVAASGMMVLGPVAASAENPRKVPILNKGSSVRDRQIARPLEERYSEDCGEDPRVVELLLDLLFDRNRNRPRPRDRNTL